jgi:hypothetical protein
MSTNPQPIEVIRSYLEQLAIFPEQSNLGQQYAFKELEALYPIQISYMVCKGVDPKTQKEFASINCEFDFDGHHFDFHGGTPDVTNILARIDYRALSLRNAGTPGFGKADLVEAYLEMLKP